MDVTDPRVARSRAAVLATAVDIVVERGPAALTIEAVVARSGVARSTIYRHWPTRDELLVDVFRFGAPSPSRPDASLPFTDAMQVFLHDLVEQLSEPKWARILPALLALKAYEPTLAAIDDHLESEQAAVSGDLFDRGISEGLLEPTIDRRQATAQLIGPLLFALIIGRPELSPGLADESLRCFLAGQRPSGSRAPTHSDER